MYPSETSLIPVSVTLAQFVADHGISAFSMWFDIWFAGLPFRYAAEPVTPLVMAAVYRLTDDSLFDISIYFVLISNIVSILGWGIFVRSVTGKWKPALIAIIVLIVLPWRLFSSLVLSEVSVVFASGMIPFVLLTYWNVISSESTFWNSFAAIIISSIAILTNVGSIPIMAVGMCGCLAISWQIYGDLSRSLKLFSLIWFITLVCVIAWYTPGYWITIWQNPSIGGNSIAGVVAQLFSLARASLPLFVALVVVYTARSTKSSLWIFTTVWFGTFLFITLYRFVLDYDFWMDWTRWFGELEVGVTLVITHRYVSYYDTYRYAKFSFVSFVIIGLITLVIYRGLHSPKLFTTTIPRSIGSVVENLEKRNDARVFLSGSDTFWVNAFTKTSQVRGGNERASLHPFWADASFQLREGGDAELTKLWTDIFGVSAVIVHSSSSDNYYHDFKEVHKWDTVSSLWEDKNGDRLYQFPEHTFGWTIDSGVLGIKPPSRGDDKDALLEYLSFRKDRVPVEKVNSSTYVFESSKGLVHLSISYHPRWKAFDEGGNELLTIRDPLGFMIVEVERDSIVTVIFDF